MKMNARTHIPLALALALTLCVPALAQESEPTPRPGALPGVDELLDLPAPPSGRPDSKLLDRAIEEEATTEPFERAIEGMRDAATRLNDRADAGIDTQRVQEQVVRRLDMMISQLRKQQQQQSQSARQKDSGSQQPSESQQRQQAPSDASANNLESNPDSVRRDTPSQEGLGDHPLEERFVEWGKLPPRLRDALRNGFNERFSTLYDALTQRYYQRLAEEGGQ